MNIVIFHFRGLDKFESADQYQTHSCPGILKNKPQINADERKFIKSADENSLLIFISIKFEFFEIDKLLRSLDSRKLIHESNHEFADRYRAHTCPDILKNKPQINADERRLIESGEENYFLIFRSNIVEFFENIKLLRVSDKHRLYKSDDDPCLSILNSILSRHLFNRTYSSHNYCN